MMSKLVRVVRKQLEFAKKGFLIESSYGVSFVLSIVDALMPLALFFLVSKMVDNRDPRLARYGGSYFSFTCLGIAFTQYFGRALAACSGNLRRAQTSGVLEATLSTQTSPISVVLYEATSSFLGALPNVVISVLASVLFFGLDLAHANWKVAALGFACALFAFLAFSLLSAGMILRTKNRDPVQFLLSGAASLLAGAYFPVSVLPHWLRIVAQAIPMTHALELLRGSILAGAGVGELWRPLAALAAMGVALMPLSFWLFSQAISQGRRDGTLLQY